MISREAIAPYFTGVGPRKGIRMHEGSDERKEEKLEEREIVFRPNAAKSERPHGKVYRWLDNFWYHHKWKTIIIAANQTGTSVSWKNSPPSVFITNIVYPIPVIIARTTVISLV